jgi:hypothetical protein
MGLTPNQLCKYMMWTSSQGGNSLFFEI